MHLITRPQLIFHLDPAQKKEISRHMLGFKDTLNYKHEILTNPINFQEPEAFLHTHVFWENKYEQFSYENLNDKLIVNNPKGRIFFHAYK